MYTAETTNRRDANVCMTISVLIKVNALQIYSHFVKTFFSLRSDIRCRFLSNRFQLKKKTVTPSILHTNIIQTYTQTQNINGILFNWVDIAIHVKSLSFFLSFSPRFLPPFDVVCPWICFFACIQSRNQWGEKYRKWEIEANTMNVKFDTEKKEFGKQKSHEYVFKTENCK